MKRIGLMIVVLLLASTVRAAPATQPVDIAELRAEVRALEAKLADAKARLAKAEATTQPAAKVAVKTYDVPGIYKAVPAELRLAVDNPSNQLLAGRLQEWANREIVGQRLRISGTVERIPAAPANAKTFTISVVIEKGVPPWHVVTCSFPIDDIDRAAKLKEGKPIKVVGTVRQITLIGHSVNGALADSAFE